MARRLLGEGAVQDVGDACAGLGELLWDGVQSLLHVVIVQRHLLSAVIVNGAREAFGELPLSASSWHWRPCHGYFAF